MIEQQYTAKSFNEMIFLTDEDGNRRKLLASKQEDQAVVSDALPLWRAEFNSFDVPKGLAFTSRVIRYQTPACDYLLSAEDVIRDGIELPHNPADDSAVYSVPLEYWVRECKSKFHETLISQLGLQWTPLLEKEFFKPYLRRISEIVHEERKRFTVHPTSDLVFNALRLTGFNNIKVVILGNEPWISGDNDGLAYSTSDEYKVPMMLQNIYSELENDLFRGLYLHQYPSLQRWAVQGVLLLNSSLTVRHGFAGSHARIGWHLFAIQVLKTINDLLTNVVFMFWGDPLRAYKQYINPQKHLILEAGSPSPLTANDGFFGCKHFSKANNYLMNKGLSGVRW